VTGDGSNLRAFVNGILQGSAAYGGSGYNGGAITPSVGSYNNGSWSSGILGLMDNVRISKGVARYTANFNPTPNVGTNPKEGAFDDSASTWWGSVQTGANVSGASYIGYNFGSPVTPKAFTIKQHANYIGSVKVQRSSDGSSWVDVQTITISENNTKNAYSFSNSTSAQYWRLLANDNPSSGSWQVEEIEFMVGAKNDMTLISNGFTAEATPSEIRIVLFEEDVDSIEINTDLKAWVSRDGGTTWTQITLVDEGDYESSKRILAGSISVSSQPSGVAVKYKVTTHNNRNMKFHGASLGWKA